VRTSASEEPPCRQNLRIGQISPPLRLRTSFWNSPLLQLISNLLDFFQEYTVTHQCDYALRLLNLISSHSRYLTNNMKSSYLAMQSFNNNFVLFHASYENTLFRNNAVEKSNLNRISPSS